MPFFAVQGLTFVSVLQMNTIANYCAPQESNCLLFAARKAFVQAAIN